MDGSNRWPETEPFGFTSKKSEMAGDLTAQQFLIEKGTNTLLMLVSSCILIQIEKRCQSLNRAKARTGVYTEN